MKVAFGRQRPSKTVRGRGRNISRRRTVDALIVLGNRLLYAAGLIRALSRVSFRANGNAPLSDGWLRPSRIFSGFTVAPGRGSSRRGRSGSMRGSRRSFCRNGSKGRIRVPCAWRRSSIARTQVEWISRLNTLGSLPHLSNGWARIGRRAWALP